MELRQWRIRERWNSLPHQWKNLKKKLLTLNFWTWEQERDHRIGKFFIPTHQEEILGNFRLHEQKLAHRSKNFRSSSLPQKVLGLNGEELYRQNVCSSYWTLWYGQINLKILFDLMEFKKHMESENKHETRILSQTDEEKTTIRWIK